MMCRLSFAAWMLLGCTSVASAAADNRIRTQAYEPDQIVRVVGRSGIQSTIEFAADERIENVAIGDSSAWQITPNRRASLLFVKPLAAHSRTNMTVVTDRRTYMFDLVSDKSSTPLYALKFSYPHDKEAGLAAKPAQPVVATAAPASATMTADKLHFDWNTKGYGKLLPARVFDDGSSLYLAWNRETPLPAILTVSEDRKEGPVSYRMNGDYIVVSPIPANLVLRYGSKSATLWPSRRITPMRPSSAPVQQALIQPSAPQLAPIQTAPAPAPQPNSASSAVRLANMTALYSDKLTDTDHEK